MFNSRALMPSTSRIMMSSLFVLALASSSGCDDESAVADADGVGGGGGAGGEGAGPAVGAPPADAVAFPEAFTASVVARGAGGAPDLACVGSARTPAGGEPLDVSLRFVDAANPTTPLGGRAVSFYPRDGVFPGTCPAFYCTETVTDDQGLVVVSVPRGGWYGYEVPGDDEVVRSFQVHTLAPMSADALPVESLVTTRVGLQKLAMLARLPRDARASYIAGRVHDCAGLALENVLISVISPDGERLQPRAADPDDGARGTVYFEGTDDAEDAPMPEPLREVGTAGNGRFAAGGVEARPGLPYKIEAWAVTAAGRAPERIACEAAVVLDDTITMVGLHPQRDDYELDHPCRFP